MESYTTGPKKQRALLPQKMALFLQTKKTNSNKFNQCFINTAKTLIENIGKSNNKFQDFLKNSNEHSFFINESTPEEIMGLIKKIRHKTIS